MPMTHPLPIRKASIDTGNPDELARIQPERQRSCVQLQRGELRFRIRELVWGEAGIQSERWSRGIRIQQDRPSSYVSFAFITQGSARWMGAPIGPGSVMRIVEPWECVTEGVLEYVAFAVSRSALESAALLVRDPGQHATPSENRVGRRHDTILLAMRLLSDLHSLEDRASHSAAFAAAGEDLLRLALFLDRPRDLIAVEHLSTSPGRLAAIRRIEAHLEASCDQVPSIPTLCQIAGVSERTLEYAFREHLGVTPLRYLKLRRLMLARRRLQNPSQEGDSVTNIVASCGIYELGRFAADYRMLFDELPSETLARSSGHPSRGAWLDGENMHAARSRFPRVSAQTERNMTTTLPQSARTIEPRVQSTP